MDIEQYRVKAGSKSSLFAWDPNDNAQLDKAEAKQVLLARREELADLQAMLYADGRHRLLIILQAIDAGGKDGTIRTVFEGVNPQGVTVTSFKRPSTEEMSHDYLWRVHQHTPARGMISIFNRSHYEDVLVVRVHQLVPEERWAKRYGHINAFEQMLVDEGTTIVKLFLHISKDEQRVRQQERIDDPKKQWKFSHDDLAERQHWDAYQEAFEDMVNKTSTAAAPWYVVPANRNWFRNLLVTEILIDTIKGFDLRYPAPAEGMEGIIVPE